MADLTGMAHEAGAIASTELLIALAIIGIVTAAYFLWCQKCRK